MDNCRFNEVSNTVVIASTSDNATVGTGLGVVNVAGASLEGLLVNHGRHEGVSLGGWTHLDGLLGLNQPLLDLVPEGLRNVHPGAGGALLSLILKCRSDSGGHNALHLSSGMNEMIIFASTFSNKLNGF